MKILSHEKLGMPELGKTERLAEWTSQRGRYWVTLYAETDWEHGLLPSYSYKTDNSGGFLGSNIAPEVAMQHAAQQASYCPSKMPRTFYNDVLAGLCCEAWQRAPNPTEQSNENPQS